MGQEAFRPSVGAGTIEINQNSLGLIALGILVGILLTAAFNVPRIGRAISKSCAVVLLAVGAGLIAWGIAGLSGESWQPLAIGPVIFMSAAQAFGWGVGALVGGVTSLVLSFVGSSRV